MRTKTPLLLACACAVALHAGVALAQEDDIASLQARADEMVAQVEQATQAYQQATADVEDLSARIAANEERLSDIQARLPQQRTRTAASIKNLYLFQQNTPSVLELVLSSESLEEFIATVQYLDAVHQRNVSEVNALTQLQDELTQAQASLAVERDAAASRQDDTLVALQNVSAARNDLQAQISRLEERAAKAVDPAEKEKVTLMAQQAADSANKAVSELPAAAAELTKPAAEDSLASSTPIAAPETPVLVAAPEPAPASDGNPTPDSSTDDGNDADVTTTEDDEISRNPGRLSSLQATTQFVTITDSEVSEWAQRIDKYLEGSELAGYGMAFAQAAATYGVDPRISPAISCVESGKGKVCFLPHNAWGWGSSSWASWEEAINDHVKGFSSIYGPTITLEGAEMYASNDIYDYWLELVLSEMSRI